jgi:hypothetical protein
MAGKRGEKEMEKKKKKPENPLLNHDLLVVCSCILFFPFFVQQTYRCI